MKKKKKRKYQKMPENTRKNKLVNLLGKVVSAYIKNLGNIHKTAKQFNVDWLTMNDFIKSKEAQKEIERVNKEDREREIQREEMIIKKITDESVKQFMLAKKKMTQKECGYFIANLLGKTSDVRIAKIQAGSGQGSIESNEQLSTEQFDRHKEITKDDKE